MENFKYFFWGKATEKFPVLYGLYNPLNDCFLLIGNELNVIKSLLYLFSSKISLFISRLDKLDNFKDISISNANCTHWTKPILFPQRFASIPNEKRNYYLEEYGELVLRHAEGNNQANEELRKMFFIAYRVICFFNKYEPDSNQFYHATHNMINYPFNEIDRLDLKQKSCYDAIYNSMTVDELESKITKILEGLPWTDDRYIYPITSTN